GVSSVKATAHETRQVSRGFLGSWLSSLSITAPEASWRLPNGSQVEPTGSPRRDVVVAWTLESTNKELSEGYLRNLWPQCRRIERLGPRLFIVEGVELEQSSTEEEP